MGTKYPIGIQNFEKLRKDNYFYVDKTALIYRLVKSGSYFFLSRPRRFGKSLLVSTLEAYFEGKRELFEGLAMERLEKEWVKRPVLHIDLNAQRYDSPESLENILHANLSYWEKTYGADSSEVGLSLRFQGIIRRAYEKTGHRVAILVDEYDKPMLQAIGNDELQNSFRDILQAFYGALKSMDGCIKFALLTGVTKFGKVSVFSALNNLMDLSMWDDYAALCGITDEELTDNFTEGIDQLVKERGMTVEEVRAELKECYDGYHFTEDSVGIYNPFSLLNTFAKRKFGNYWFETGTPTYLVELLKMHQYDLHRMANVETDADTLNSVDSSSTDPIPVIYQSGYLTIKSYDEEFGTYHLGFPNREVEEGFMKFLLPFYANTDKVDAPFQINKFVREVRSGDYDAFFHRLQSFFADTPYELVRELELHYQNVLFIVFKLIGFYVKAEYHTSQGRIDLLLQTDQFVYIMEFKLEGTAEEALKQINEKNYAAPFACDTRKLYKIGINFSSQMRNIERWVVE